MLPIKPLNNEKIKNTLSSETTFPSITNNDNSTKTSTNFSTFKFLASNQIITK